MLALSLGVASAISRLNLATKSLEEAIDTYYPTGQYAQQAQLELLYSKFKQKIMKVRLHSQNVLFV